MVNLNTQISEAYKLLEAVEKITAKLEKEPEDIQFWKTKTGDFFLHAGIKITDPIAKLNRRLHTIQENPDDYYLVKTMNTGYKVLIELRENNKLYIKKAVKLTHKLESFQSEETTKLSRALEEEIDRLCPERKQKIEKLRNKLSLQSLEVPDAA